MSNQPFENTGITQKKVHCVVSRLTPPQPGALSVIGIHGVRACSTIQSHFQAFRDIAIESLAVGRVVVGQWNHEFLSSGDRICFSGERSVQSQECIVLVRTGTQTWEIHSHGGMAVVQSFLEIFASAGADVVSWDKWLACMQKDTRDTTVRKQLAQVDGSCEAQILTRQLAGAFEKDIKRVQQALDTTPRCLDQLVLAKSVINRLERAARIGLRLTQPWRVILLGPVNTGKSSLVNAIAGYDRSIVSSHAGTTRDVLEARVVIDGWSVNFIDTAGFHLADNQKREIDGIEKKGIDRAAVEASNADLIVYVQSLDQLVADGFTAAQFSDNLLLGNDLPPYISVGTKSDLCGNKQLYGQAISDQWVPTSARTGQGIEHLMQVVLETLVPEIKDHPDCFLEGVPVSPEDVDVVRKLHQQLEIYSRDL